MLLGATEREPKDIGLTQFRKFVDDCHILPPGAAKADVDITFTRVNRVPLSLSQPQNPEAPPRPKIEKKEPTKRRSDVRRGALKAEAPSEGGGTKADVSGAARPDRIGQDEFVHAIVRLGLIRAEHEQSEAATSLSRSFEKVTKGAPEHEARALT